MVLVLNSNELPWKRKVAISFQPELGPLGANLLGEITKPWRQEKFQNKMMAQNQSQKNSMEKKKPWL